MKIRKYHAPTMKAALEKVKSDLGEQAVILHTRHFTQGGILGFGAREVVEITASMQARKPEQARPAQRPEARKYKEAAMLSSARDLLVKARSCVKEKSERLEKMNVEPPQKRSGGIENVPAKPAAATSEPAYDLREDLSSIKSMLKEVARYAARDLSGELPPALAAAYSKLVKADVCESTAWEIVIALRDSLSDCQNITEKQVNAYLFAELSSRLKTSGPISVPDGKKGAVIFIGPTGVGKTTTIAKLAAEFSLNQGKKVGLVTVDTYRIAAVEQLRTYARIIQVPLSIAETSTELERSIAKFSDRDLVFVDTAGRSQRDSVKMEELEELLSAGCGLEKLLVIDSTSQPKKAFEVIDRFRSVKPDRLILTKLDEAPSLGMVMDLIDYSGLPVSYVTTGQEVPDDIEVARSESLAELLTQQEDCDA